VTTPARPTPPLPPPLLARSQEAQVATDEANARKAAADADTSALSLAQAKGKSLVPDLTGVATNAVDDKSADVAFSGLVTYSALKHAAEIVAYQISNALGKPADGHEPTMLVTSQSDLLTNDLLSSTVATGLSEFADFADKVLKFERPSSADYEKPGAPTLQPARTAELELEIWTRAIPTALAGGAATAAGAGVATAALGPVGLGAAAAAAIPSIVSLFSSTTTVKSHSEDISDLATTTSVVSAVSEKLAGYTVLHEDFRLAPAKSAIRDAYRQLAQKRTELVFKQEREQVAKNEADLELSRAQQQQDAAKKATPPKQDDAGLAIDDATLASANAAAVLSLITAAITRIDAFTTVINVNAAGTRSPLAIASLNELLHEGDNDRISYVLSVKGLGGQSEDYTKNRHIGVDTYTTLADASISFMLYDTAAKKIIGSGVANGVSSVHGRLGHPPTGLVGPNATDAISDQATDASPSEGGQQGQPAGHPHRGWRHLFGPLATAETSSGDRRPGREGPSAGVNRSSGRGD
jgi:hypothetical protein